MSAIRCSHVRCLYCAQETVCCECSWIDFEDDWIVERHRELTE